MGSTETLYSATFRLADLLERERANVLRCPVYRAGVRVAPASGTISIYSPEGTVAVSAAAVTITDGIATYTLTAGQLSSYQYGEGWRVEWTLTFASPSEVHLFRNDGALVRVRLYPAATEQDLYRLCSSLDPNGPTEPISTGLSYEDKLDEAWTQIQEMLIGRGNRPNLIMTPSAFRSAHCYLTLALIFEDFSTRLNDAYETRAASYRDQFRDAWRNLNFAAGYADATSAATDAAAPGRRSPHPGGFWIGGRGRNVSGL